MPAPDLHSVASASLAIFAQRRPVARDLLQAKITLEAQERTRTDGPPCGQEAGLTLVHTRTVRPETLFGEITIPVRTFWCRGGGALCRPDDSPLGVPEVGDVTDDVRSLEAPVAAALPPRVASAIWQRCTGVRLSSRGAPGIIDSSAEDLRPWQVERETREAEAVADAWASGDGIADLRVELAMDGVPAPSDGRWPQPKVATVLVCQLDTQAEEPTLGVLLARRDGCVLGPAEELAVRVQQTIQAAGWEHLPSGAILGDGAPGSWHVAAAAFPGGRQTLDDEHLSEHLDALAQLLYPTNPAGAKAWVDQQLGRLLMDHVGVVLSARKRLRPWQKAIGDALAQLIGDGERHPTRIRYQTPWPTGLAVGAGAGEGACKHGMHRRCKRAGLRWQQPGFRNVLAVRIAPLHGTFQAFWASRGLTVQGAG